ncbi:MAG TPA: hypothetical protein PK530_13450 [Anaerolineales bacterium]|nr:hypothetical protein [Anaerolineales bacterium]
MKKILFVVIAVILVVGVLSIINLQTKISECDAIVNPVTSTVDFQTISKASSPAWANSNLDAEDKNIEWLIDEAKGLSLLQVFGSVQPLTPSKYLFFFQDDALIAIQEGNRGDFTSGLVLKCFGKPEAYEAYLDKDWGVVYLWFPQKGVMTESYIFGNVANFQEKPPHFDGSEISNVFYYRTSNLEEVALLTRAIWFTDLNSFELKNWPGNWKKIEFITIEQ